MSSLRESIETLRNYHTQPPEKYLKEIPQDENIVAAIKGRMGEWLICTDKQLYIIKKGMCTGNTFGTGNFQMPYRNITNVSIVSHLGMGYFEVSAGGIQQQKKSYWYGGKENNPQMAPNCVAISNRQDIVKFKAACSYINAKAAEDLNVVNTYGELNRSPADEIKKYADLAAQGIISEEEFQKKKNYLLNL